MVTSFLYEKENGIRLGCSKAPYKPHEPCKTYASGRPGFANYWLICSYFLCWLKANAKQIYCIYNTGALKKYKKSKSRCHIFKFFRHIRFVRAIGKTLSAYQMVPSFQYKRKYIYQPQTGWYTSIKNKHHLYYTKETLVRQNQAIAAWLAYSYFNNILISENFSTVCITRAFHLRRPAVSSRPYKKAFA